MGKNDYLQRQKDKCQAYFDAGERIGMQKMWDYIVLVLRDPAIMGKDTFGRERLDRIWEELKKAADLYHTAFTDDKEADYYQELMDKQFRAIWGDKTLPFYERYSELKKQTYNKPKKGWV